MKKHSKALRVFCIVVPVLLVVVLLLTALSPLWKKDDRVSASAASRTLSFNFAFEGDGFENVAQIMTAATFSYVSPSGIPGGYAGIVNSTNGFLLFSNISIDDTKDVTLSVGLKAGFIFSSAEFTGSHGTTTVSVFDNYVRISGLDDWSGGSLVSVKITYSGAPPVTWRSAGFQIYSDELPFSLNQYIASATLSYFESDELPVSLEAFKWDEKREFYGTNGVTIDISKSTSIGIKVIEGVTLDSVSVVVGTGGIHGTNVGGILAVLETVQGEENYYSVNLSISDSLSDLMFCYLIPTFSGAPNPDGNYQDGYNDGFSDGYDSGYGDGYDVGYDGGYYSGYNQGFSDGQNLDWGDLNVVSLYLQPVSTFLGTPLFGNFSIGTAFSVVLVVLLASIFIKMFAGG